MAGFALHAGVRTAVTLEKHDGPIAFWLPRQGAYAPFEQLSVARTAYGVSLRGANGFEVDLVEHLLAALGGLGIHEGVRVTVDGPELPILDGGAATFADALAELGIEPRNAGPRLRVQREATLRHEDSVYEMDVANRVDLEVEFVHAAIGRQTARWLGDAPTFRTRIAPARTFGFARDAAALFRQDRARLAQLAERGDQAPKKAFENAVLVVGEPGERPDGDDELARHKLLDLIGDLTFYGGPPTGRVRAVRPGHTATHRIIRLALEQKILAPPSPANFA